MVSRVQDRVRLYSALSRPSGRTAVPAELFSTALNQQVGKIARPAIKPRVTAGSRRRVAGGAWQLFGARVATANILPGNPLEPKSETNPFVPQFQQNVTVSSAFGGSWSLNPAYFATAATAQWMARKYGTGEVVAVPYGGQGGPFAASATEYNIKLADGRMINAGLLADYYTRMPEAQFPGLADRCVQDVVSGKAG